MQYSNAPDNLDDALELSDLSSANFVSKIDYIHSAQPPFSRRWRGLFR